jgi:hypothetical protein
MTTTDHKRYIIVIMAITLLASTSITTGCTDAKSNDNNAFTDAVLENSVHLTRTYADLILDWDNYPLMKIRTHEITLSVDEHIDYIQSLHVSDDLKESKFTYLTGLNNYKSATEYLILSSHARYAGMYDSSISYFETANEKQEESNNNINSALQKLTEYYEALA